MLLLQLITLGKHEKITWKKTSRKNLIPGEGEEETIGGRERGVAVKFRKKNLTSDQRVLVCPPTKHRCVNLKVTK